MATKSPAAQITIWGDISGALKSALGTTRQHLQGIGGSIKELTTRQQTAPNHWEKMGRDASRFHSELKRVNAELDRQRKMQTVIRQQDANTRRRGELRGQLFDAVALVATLAAPIRVGCRLRAGHGRGGRCVPRNRPGVGRTDENRARARCDDQLVGQPGSRGHEVPCHGRLRHAADDCRDAWHVVAGECGAVDLGQASDIASNILSGFNMKAEEMGRLGDVLVNAFTSSNTNLQTRGAAAW